MMKFIAAIGLIVTFALPSHAQDMKKSNLDSIYNPKANAEAELAAVIKKAAVEKKHVLVQVGGNWCIWCKRLYKFVDDNAELSEYRDNNYIVYHLNYSPENKNLPILAKYGYPQRFGFPVLLVLDGKGKLLHIQDSGLLESADSYDKRKVLTFFKQWTMGAINPATYQPKS
ncbi:thioredoxin family protein [uncultured Chitinophaga sp.]|uniref:thioredoxin family protein n=1 Tax=uncultured Chitinophaga sp. TaxID=339340 RepID=UPI0025CE53EC|nr:thioredoxin family protein [uncultured Chitinophaga sp.]